MADHRHDGGAGLLAGWRRFRSSVATAVITVPPPPPPPDCMTLRLRRRAAWVRCGLKVVAKNAGRRATTATIDYLQMIAERRVERASGLGGRGGGRGGKGEEGLQARPAYLLFRVGPLSKLWLGFHFESWETGAQNFASTRI